MSKYITLMDIVAVLSGFALFLIDYFGEELYDKIKKICSLNEIDKSDLCSYKLAFKK